MGRAVTPGLSWPQPKLSGDDSVVPHAVALSFSPREVSVSRTSLRGRISPWGALVPVVALLAGLLFATSGRTAQGTDLRAGEITKLSQLID